MSNPIPAILSGLDHETKYTELIDRLRELQNLVPDLQDDSYTHHVLEILEKNLGPVATLGEDMVRFSDDYSAGLVVLLRALLVMGESQADGVALVTSHAALLDGLLHDVLEAVKAKH